MAAPDWLPLWTDASAYPSPDSLQPWQWAWEFLRRNTSYQAKWNEVVGPLKKGQPVDCVTRALFRQEFGIIFPKNPASKTIIPLLLQYSLRTASVDDFDGTTGSIPIAGYYDFAVVFDLSLDIDTQIKVARKELENKRRWLVGEGMLSVEPGTRKAPDLWPDYLRLLDAEASGASHHEMAKMLYPKVPDEYPDFKARKQVQNRLEAAHKMCNEGYRMVKGHRATKSA
jgi:hypothetical protein